MTNGLLARYRGLDALRLVVVDALLVAAMNRRDLFKTLAALWFMPTPKPPPLPTSTITVVASSAPPLLIVDGQRIAVDVGEITAFGDHWRRYMPGKRSNRER
jgi:hypothetical protein